MSWWRWFGSRRGDPEADKLELDAEIEAHLAMAAADARSRGLDDATAQREAQREFGNVALVKDVTREAWGWVWLERVQQDLKYALRQMSKSKGFAIAVIGTLALGIGAATAMFTVVDHVLLRPLPYADVSRLVEIYENSGSGDDRSPSTYLDIAAWREQAKSFDEIAFYSNRNGRSFAEGKDATTQVAFMLVSGNLFRTLGVSPQLGVGLKDRPESFAKRGDDRTLVMSDSAWRTLFGADRGILGKTVRVNGEPYTVVGVMPRGFSFPFGSGMFFPFGSELPQMWAPVVLGAKDQERTYDSRYNPIARLRRGVAPAQAAAEMETIQARVALGYEDPEWRADVNHARLEKYGASDVPKETTKALLALTAAAGLLWLIACLNATNLLLARASARQREMAMRGALGASRWRLMQQLILEGLVLSEMAAVLGAGLALGSILFFHHMLMEQLPFAAPSTVSWRVLAVLVGLTLVSAVVSSAWPAVLAAKSPIERALRQGGQQSGATRSQHRVRSGLVIAEIALSLALLAACGLLLRTIYALRHVPLGFRTDHILVANMQVPTYKFAQVNAATSVYEPLLVRVQHMPGIDAAGLMTQVPLGHTFQVHLSLRGDSGKGENTVISQFKAVSPELQKVFGFQMLKGRYFNAGDTASSEPVVVVNRAFARAFDPHEQDAGKVIGKKLVSLSPKGTEGKPTTIIGVLDDFHQYRVSEPSEPEVQVIPAQVSPESGYYTVLEGIAMDLAVRTRRSPSQVIPELRAALKQASPELAESKFTTMDQIVEDSYGSQMLAARLLEIFAGSALLLCVAGLYGLLAYVVSQRTREMGVRFALGAQRGDVLWLVMRQAGVLVVWGVALGMGMAFAAGKLVRSYLYGVSAHDGWTLAGVAVLLMLSGAVAAYLPARRAAEVNPVEALRVE